MYRIMLIIVMATLALSLCWATDETQAAKYNHREDKLGDMLMVGIEMVDTMDQEAYMTLWEKFFEFDSKIPNAMEDAYYGISFATQTAEGKDAWGYMVAAAVKSLEEVPEEMVVRKIPARKYVVFEHKGSVEKIGGLYEYIYSQYANSGKHKLLFAESLERYDHRYKAGSEDSIMEIWVPVE
jgi:AraC family transcriptional regulator